MLTWVLVAVGGAAGSALGVLLLRRPSRMRLLAATASVCGVMGAFGAQPHSPNLTALLGYGVLGSAASMLAISTSAPTWLGGDAPLRSAWAVTKKLAVHCVVGVTFALIGYLAVRGGYTLYVKLR